MDDATQNGAGIDAEDAALVAGVQRRIERRRRRIDELEAELAEQRPQLKRDERVIALLTGAEPTGPGRPAGAKSKVRDNASRIGPETLATIEAAIRNYAADHEEFRQVDIRKMPNAPVDKSSQMAVAFEQLREQNVIRFVRQDGNAKVFRLTREAVTASE
jgi:hypothetical protein